MKASANSWHHMDTTIMALQNTGLSWFSTELMAKIRTIYFGCGYDANSVGDSKLTAPAFYAKAAPVKPEFKGGSAFTRRVSDHNDSGPIYTLGTSLIYLFQLRHLGSRLSHR